MRKDGALHMLMEDRPNAGSSSHFLIMKFRREEAIPRKHTILHIKEEVKTLIAALLVENRTTKKVRQKFTNAHQKRNTHSNMHLRTWLNNLIFKDEMGLRKYLTNLD